MPQLHLGTCHCGAVHFKVDADITSGVICDCSICIRKSAIMALIDHQSFSLISGEEDLSSYQFNSLQAIHYFCRHCGIYTHHKRRSGEGIAINSACLDGFHKDQLTEITYFEGSKLSLVK